MDVLFSEIPWGPLLILLPLAGGVVCFVFPVSAKPLGLLTLALVGLGCLLIARRRRS